MKSSVSNGATKNDNRDLINDANYRVELQRKYDKPVNHSIEYSISAQNKGLEDYLFEGDIVLTPEELTQMTNSRQKRQISRVAIQWDKTQPIYYTFSDNATEEAKKMFPIAAKFWSDNTCLNLTESEKTPNIVVFHGDGCYSKIGRDSQSKYQILSLGDGCHWFRTATHEIAHALGKFSIK